MSKPDDVIHYILEAMWRKQKDNKKARREYSMKFDAPENCNGTDPAIAVWADGAKMPCQEMTCAESLKRQAVPVGDEKLSL